jgi:Cd2+/Zn2+-exporting ATPase
MSQDHGESGGDGQRLRLSVPSMDCPSCADTVESALADVAGVEAVEPRPAGGTAVVTIDSAVTTSEAVVAAVEAAGYPVEEVTGADAAPTMAERDSPWRSRRALETGVGGVAVLAGLTFMFAVPAANVDVVSVGGYHFALADVFFLLAVALAGRAIVEGGYRSLLARSLDIDLLMSLAIGGALLASLVFDQELYFEAATLAVLFGIAELLETYAMVQARGSLRELMALSPDEATVLRDGEEVTIPADDLTVGDTVVVRPGEKIPADGTVIEGESAVDQSAVTGESVPVDRTPGDTVYAGTMNETGYLELDVTAAAGDDTLSNIVRLVEDAEAATTDREQFVERFAAYYTPLVVGFAVLIAVVPPLVLGASLVTHVVYGLTLLVLACPCAFVIATPVSVVSGITSAARNGVLVKGGTHLEAMAAVDCVAFDKTGTLTAGQLTVTDVVPLGDHTQAEVLACARGVETRSEHPIGEAIVEEAAAADAASPPVSDFESLTGEGVRADLDGTTHYAGGPGLFADLGFDLTHVHAATDGGVVTERTRDLCERNDCLDLLDELVPRLQSEGKTVVLVGTEDRLEGVIALADEIRPEAAPAVERLREQGVERLVMLTGDNERTARAIATEIGLDDHRAALLPEEKVAALEDLRDEHDGVAMVGDGINDAPALATATVGIAMGAAGTDTALETADVALLGDDLSKLPYLRSLAERTVGVIRQNVWASLAVKAGLALAVPFGFVPIWLAVLAGDAGMTVGVTGNAMRLAGVEEEYPAMQSSVGSVMQ